MKFLLFVLGFMSLFPVRGTAQTVPDTSTDAAPVFKAGVDIVSLNVIVTDRKGQFVSGLDRADFGVLEDGVTQELSYFAASRVPLDLALVLDASSSMGQRMGIVHEAAIGFVKTLGPHDRASVIAFSDGVRQLQDFTNDFAQLEVAIRKTAARGSTALRNALYITLKEFAKQSRALPDVRRQAIVVLSDGDDTASVVDSDALLDLAKRSGVAIYPIALRATGGSEFNQSEYELRELAKQTGGRTFFPRKIEELAGVYGGIASELQSEYSLGYVSANLQRDGKFRRVNVRILTRPDMATRSRAGYFAQSEPRAMFGSDTR